MTTAEQMVAEAAKLTARAAGYKMAGDKALSHDLAAVAADLLDTARRLERVMARERTHTTTNGQDTVI